MTPAIYTSAKSTTGTRRIVLRRGNFMSSFIHFQDAQFTPWVDPVDYDLPEYLRSLPIRKRRMPYR
jgi:hypothetical protein